MTWVLRLYNSEGKIVGTANYLRQSYSVEMDAPKGEVLRDALSKRDEFHGLIRPTDDEDFGEVAVFEDPEVALDRVGSAMVASGLVESYEVTTEE